MARLSDLELAKNELRSRTGVSGNPAPTTIVINNSELAHTWEARPAGSICFGLRIPSEAEKQQISKDTINQVIDAGIEDNAEREAEFERQQMLAYVARSICDPNDVTKAHPEFLAPDAQLPRCLTPGAIRRIFDACEKLVIDSSPLYPEASDEDLELLAAALTGGDLEALELLEPHREQRVRRYAKFILDELRPG